MAQSKIAQQKEKDFDDVVPREGFCDMSEEDQETVVAAAREACKKHHDGEFKYYKTMAIYIKEQLDKKLGGSWHIIVGKLQLLVPFLHQQLIFIYSPVHLTLVFLFVQERTSAAT